MEGKIMIKGNDLKQLLKEVCISNGQRQMNNFSHFYFYEVPIPKELKKYLSQNKTKE